ncbi:rRNA maturation RNase YbeY [Rubripirellula sp.]|nr:rRNA maturation RNase YbeY [Rubripirellula sp.]
MTMSADQMDALQVDVIVDDQVAMPVQATRLVEAAVMAARHRGCQSGEIGIRVAGDAEIQQVNRTHLQHDYPTDVISFGYLHQPPRVEGELVVSAETAARTAVELNWIAANELILYVVHGTLHLCGMDDQQPEARIEMRQAEMSVMQKLGIAMVDRHAVDPVELGTNAEPETSSPLVGDQSVGDQSVGGQSVGDDGMSATHSRVPEERE